MPFKIIGSERGIALVIALGMSLIIMMAAIAIGLNSGFFTGTTRVTRELDQLGFVADLGIENYRYYLWNTLCPPPNWCGAQDANGESQTIPDNQYVSVMWSLKNSGMFSDQTFSIDDNNTYQFEHHITESTALNIVKGHVHYKRNGSYIHGGNYDYRVFAKRGPNPKILYVMSTAMKRKKIEEYELSVEQFEKRGSIEAALHFSVPCPEDYKQFGQCPSKAGVTGEKGIATQLRGSF